MLENLKQYRILLASKSPRRQDMLKDLGLEFELITKDGIEEIYPEGLDINEIPIFLSKLKADAFLEDMKINDLLITADTIVCIGNEVLGKPKDKADAQKMLRNLSGKSHQVISGVCLKTKDKEVSFSTATKVVFKNLTDDEIEYYIDNYKPFDKAGAYGIQEWIGYIGIESIEGSYFNVVGLPIQRLYTELAKF